jgi:hypothetical protein
MGSGLTPAPHASSNHNGHEAHEEHEGEEGEEGEAGQEGGLFVYGDALLVKPRRRPHDLAITTPRPDFALVGADVQKFDWDTVFGYRLGVGYRMPHSWEIAAVYTYLHSNDQLGVARPAGGSHSALGATGSSNLDLDLIDTEIAKRWWICEGLQLRAAAGARVATISQKIGAAYDFTPTGVGISNVNQRIQFDGIGPRIGGEAFWKMWENFGFWGKFYSSLLSGDFKTNVNQWVNNGRTIILDVNDKFYKVVPVTEVGIGLGWRSDHLSVNVGYELQNFFGMVELNDFPTQSNRNIYRQGDLSLEALTFSVGLYY